MIFLGPCEFVLSWPTRWGLFPPKTTLELLDVYEDDVRKQMSPIGSPGLIWNEELLEINLRRYILYSAEHRNDVAEQILVQAATIRKKGATPTKGDIEFLRALALRLYSPKP